MSKFISTETQAIINDITSQSTPHEMLSLWSAHREKLQGIRLLTQVDDYNSTLLPAKVRKKTFEGQSHAFMQEFYNNEKLLVISNEILDAHSVSKTIALPIDYSLLLDSNYVGSIDLFIRGESTGSNHAALTKSLHYIRSNNINCDALPYLLENAEHATERITDIKRTFANFLRSTSAKPKHDKISTPDDLVFGISEKESINEAERRLLSFYGNQNFIKNTIDRQKIDFYIVLSMIHIEHFIKGTLEEKFSKFARIMHMEIGRISLRDLAIAYKYFKNNNSIFILSNIKKSIIKTRDSIKTIRNISWDFHFFRLMETWASDTSRGAFFIPMFVTLDKRLANLNEIYPIKYSVFHNAERIMYSTPQQQITEYISDKKCKQTLADYFDSISIEQRSKTPSPKQAELDEKIKQKGLELDSLFIQTDENNPFVSAPKSRHPN